MKVAVVGAGPAGSYLARRLHGVGFEVRLFDRQPREGFRAICAWGTEEGPMSDFARRCGLRFGDYVLWRGKKMQVETRRGTVDLGVEGLCTFDKARFLRDLWNGTPALFGKRVKREDLSEFDMAVDATGPIRALLPPVREDVRIPCIQHRIEYERPPHADFYVKPFPDASGYLWYFPLGNSQAHVGAGSLTHSLAGAELGAFMERHPGKTVESVGKTVRVLAPRCCRPFFVDGHPPVVGVGESVGTVMPVAGEGIQWSLKCAELLFENLKQGMDLARYEASVLRQFKDFTVYDALGRAARERRRGRALLWALAMGLLGVKPRFLTELRWGEMLRLARKLGWA